MTRPILPANDAAAHAAWLADALAAPFHQPRKLPRLVHPKAEPAPPAPRELDLVDLMAAAPPAPERPWYTLKRMPVDEMLRAHFGGAISPPSPLALKRRELRRERERERARAVDGGQGPGTPAPARVFSRSHERSSPR